MGQRKRKDNTTIEVSTENWRDLNRKKNPGESFGEVIDRLLGEESHQTHNTITSISVDKTIWRKLKDGKGPGDSFDDVVTRLIEKHE